MRNWSSARGNECYGDFDKSALPVLNLRVWEEKELVGSGDMGQVRANIAENHEDI